MIEYIALSVVICDPKCWNKFQILVIPNLNSLSATSVLELYGKYESVLLQGREGCLKRLTEDPPYI